MTPEVRFKGFDGDWKSKRINQISDVIGGGTPDTTNPSYWDGDIDWYSPVEIGNNRYADGSIRKITPAGLQKSSASVLPAGKTILFTSRAGIGKTAILRKPGSTNQGFQSMVLNEGVDPYFVYSLSKDIKDKAEAVASGSTFTEISGKMLGNLIVGVPHLNEQNAVGSFFEHLDSLIEQSQSEVDRLRNLKKAMLLKMFPQKGSKVPEIRFKGFSGEWKLKKLGDVFDILQNNTLSRAELDMEAGAAINIHYGDVLINYGDCHDVASSCKQFIASEKTAAKYRSSWLRNGDVVMADTAEDETAGKCTEINGVEELTVISGLHTIPLRPRQNFATGFLGYFMNSGSYHNQLIPYMHGTKVVSVSKGEIKETDIFYPGDIEEQRFIGQYFQNLDSLIEQRQSNTERLRNLKQAMLQRMFV